jgi:hypothetical protein
MGTIGYTDAGPGRAGQRAARTGAGALAAVLLAALVGCSSGGGAGGGGGAGYSAGSAREASGQQGGAGDTAAGKPAPAAANPAGKAADTGQSQVQGTVALPRALVRTAELTVRVDDVGRSASRIGGIARAGGGEVYGDSRYGSGDEAKADLVLKVDPERLDGVLGQIAALGVEAERSSSTEDVTEQVADVDSRVATMKASIARVRALLARAKTVGELVSVEGELSRREADLEALQAKQRTLAGQVALATVTVHLLARKAAEPAAAKAGRGFRSGLVGGWHAFSTAVGWLLTALGAVLPFALLALLVLVALAGWRVAAARTRRGRPAAATPAPDSPGE